MRKLVGLIRALLFNIVLILMSAAYATVHTPLKISTSIQPLGLMLTELTQHTQATIKVLIPTNQSSHDFSLRPKDIVALNQADLIIWIGPELENFLQKPIEDMAKHKPDIILTLLNIPAIKNQLLPLRTGVQWQDTHHDHNHEHSQADHTDPHIWLLPETNLAIARLITKKLININPAQAKTYLANFERLANQLVYIDSLYRQAFHHRYLVLHDSYQYIERKYGLKVMGVLAIHADRPASIKTIRQAQQSIRQNQVTCILGEPPFQEKLIRVLLEGQTENKPIFIQLSPLADKFALTAGNYEKWQIQMVEKIRNCH